MSDSNKTDRHETQPQQSLKPTTLKLLILSKTPSSGILKSSVAYEVCNLLRAQRITHAHIDGDNLDAVYPLGDDSRDIMLLNLKLIWATYWTHFEENCVDNEMGRPIVVVLSGTDMINHVDDITKVFVAVATNRIHETNGKRSVNIDVSPFTAEGSDDNGKSITDLALRTLRGANIQISHTVQTKKDDMDGTAADTKAIMDYIADTEQIDVEESPASAMAGT